MVTQIPVNYRPNSMLPFLIKLFTQLMCATSPHLNSNNILDTNQFGLRKNSNASDAIIEFLDYIYSSLDSKQSTIAVYLAFPKVFDTVNHNMHNGIRGVMQSWLESYLSNSKQYVAVPLCQTLLH